MFTTSRETRILKIGRYLAELGNHNYFKNSETWKKAFEKIQPHLHHLLHKRAPKFAVSKFGVISWAPKTASLEDIFTIGICNRYNFQSGFANGSTTIQYQAVLKVSVAQITVVYHTTNITKNNHKTTAENGTWLSFMSHICSIEYIHNTNI